MALYCTFLILKKRVDLQFFMQPSGQKKKLLYWRNPTDPKIRPDPTFKKKKKKKKNLNLALKMLILGFETWL